MAVLLGALLLASLQLAAADTVDAGSRAERDLLAQVRLAIEAQFSQAEIACQPKFLMTACLDAARAERRRALAAVQRQQLVQDDAQRRARAADRLRTFQALGRETAALDAPLPAAVLPAPVDMGSPLAPVAPPGRPSRAPERPQAAVRVSPKAAAQP